MEVCPFCSKNFKSALTLGPHLLSQHPEALQLLRDNEKHKGETTVVRTDEPNSRVDIQQALELREGIVSDIKEFLVDAGVVPVGNSSPRNDEVRETNTESLDITPHVFNTPIVTKIFENETRGVLVIESPEILSPKRNLWNVKLDLLIASPDFRSLEKKIHDQIIPATSAVRGQVRYTGLPGSAETFQPFEIENVCLQRLIESGKLFSELGSFKDAKKESEQAENEVEESEVQQEPPCDHSWEVTSDDHSRDTGSDIIWYIICKKCGHYMTEDEYPSEVEFVFEDESE